LKISKPASNIIQPNLTNYNGHIVCRLCKIDIAVQKCNDDSAEVRAILDEVECSKSNDADKITDL